MPNARQTSLTLVALFATALPLAAQQPDSLARADSIRADSIREAELARIRGEVRARTDTGSSSRSATPARQGTSSGGPLALTVTGEALGDFSPKAAARAPGSRFRTGDLRVGLGAQPTPRLRADLSLTIRHDSAPQISVAMVTFDLVPDRLSVRAGRQAVPFGIAAPLHRLDLWFPDHPLPVRAFLGQRGLRSNGLLLGATQRLVGLPLTLRLGAFDRFGDRIDSLSTPEPGDQSFAGIAGFARLSLDWNLRGARVSLGASSMSGKREQPIGCVYQATIGPVPCPNGINGANTRMSVFGGDVQLTVAALSLEGEWMRNVVGATDLPYFDRPGFAPYYAGMFGTYDGGYVQLRLNGPGIVRLGARVEGTQNPAVAGLDDGSAAGFVGVEPIPGGRVILSYERRLPSAAAKDQLSLEEREALDRIVLRGTIALSWLLDPAAR